MKKIGLFYAEKANKTSRIAKKIRETFGMKDVDLVSVEDAWQNDFEAYDDYIIGASTWFDGELPTSWDELRPELEALNLKGKKVALFGLGDQVNYPDNFADALGILGEILEKAGATLIGFTSSDGYTFGKSKALRGDKWCGLVIDVENQSGQTDKRIKDWCKQIKEELK